MEYAPTNPSFDCTASVSTKPNMENSVGNVGAEQFGHGAPRTRDVTGLSKGTQYWLGVKCGPSASRVWDYAVLPVMTQ